MKTLEPHTRQSESLLLPPQVRCQVTQVQSSLEEVAVVQHVLQLKTILIKMLHNLV